MAFFPVFEAFFLLLFFGFFCFFFPFIFGFFCSCFFGKGNPLLPFSVVRGRRTNTREFFERKKKLPKKEETKTDTDASKQT